MDSQVDTLDIMLKGKKKGYAYDVNPVQIETDQQCKDLLEQLKINISPTDSQKSLLDRCISVVSAKDGDNVTFGPVEIIALSELAEANPSYVTEIMACSQHLSESVDCHGDVPSNIYMDALDSHMKLSDVMLSALKVGPISDQTNLSDEEFEEEITDEEE